MNNRICKRVLPGRFFSVELCKILDMKAGGVYHDGESLEDVFIRLVGHTIEEAEQIAGTDAEEE